MSEAMFTDRSVLVTGATRGIGQALARRATEVAGQVGIVVDNAGIAASGPAGATSGADFDADYRSKKRGRSAR